MFSRKTIFEIINALNFQTHDEAEHFALEFGLESAIDGTYVKQKGTSIVRYLILNPDEKGPNGSNLVIEIIEYALKQYGGYEKLSERHPALSRSLERDGFSIADNVLMKILPSELPIAKKEDQMISLLDQFGFSIAKGHYDQAVAAHARGDWASTNAQLRTFVEEFFNKSQHMICPGNYRTSNERKNALADAGFFIKEYNEYLYNGTGFIEGFWKRLHPQGSHPGLSEQLDSTFRLQLVILVIQHFLVRLEKCKKP